MSTIKIILFFVTLFIVNTQVYSQKQISWGFEAKYRMGYLVAHRIVLSHLPQELSLGGDFTLFFNTNGSKKWHEKFNYPRIGITYTNFGSGNDEFIGNINGLYSSLEIPFSKNTKHVLNGKIGVGLSHIEKIFNQKTNPKNMAIGSHINAIINLGINYRYFFNSKNHLIAGLDFVHCSNGASVLPNLGLNYPQFNLGYGYTFHEMHKSDSSFQRFSIPSKWRFSVTGIYSIKQVYPTDGTNYNVFGLSVNTQKIFSQYKGVEFSLDGFYKENILAYKPEIEKTKSSILQAGISVAYILPLDKLHFVIGMGTYLRDKYKADYPLYHRLGMRYRFNEKLYANLTLKSHWGKADYVEYGIGYTF